MSAPAHPASSRRWMRALPALMGGGFLLLVIIGLVWMVKSFIAGADKPERPRVQQISLVKPPPPRPEIKPPEPKIEEIKDNREEVKLDEATPDEARNDDGPPPGEQLGLDADGAAGGDAFGLAARRGGRDITTLGGGGGGDREAWYARAISRHLEEGLRRAKALQGASYQVQVQLWFDDGGAVQRVRLVRGSGNAETDERLREEILGLPPLRDAIPADLQQPIRVRVTSRT